MKRSFKHIPLGGKVKIATHNGTFHADDVFAVAALRLLPEFKDAEIIRTRVDSVIDIADLRVDVGGKNNPQTGDFDHHMKGGAGIREDIPYAAFGLVWKHYGSAICGNEEIANRVERRLVMPVDAYDNGMRTGDGMRLYPVSRAVKALNQDWDFALEFATRILSHEVNQARQEIAGEKVIIRAVEKKLSPNVLLLDESCRWDHYVGKNLPDVRVIVYPSVSGPWHAQIAFNNRERGKRYFPLEWAGLQGESLARVSGVADAIFCNYHRYLAAAKSREGALKLAALSLEPGEIPIDLDELERKERVHEQKVVGKAKSALNSLLRLLHIRA